MEMKITYPKVEFKVIQIKNILPTLNYFLNNKEHLEWGKSILKKHPKLKKELNKIKDKAKRRRIIKKYFESFLLSHKKEFKEDVKRFQKEWDKINKKFMLTLSNVLEVEWPKKDKKIKAFVSPNPICPRYIKERTFDIYYDFSIDIMKSTSFHEILHFLYFVKWKQIFPKTKEREFDGPYLVWQLSEMVPLTILSDKRIQKILKHKPSVYRDYQKIRIKGKPLLLYLQEFYNNKKNFEDFLRKSWAFVKKYEKKIKGI